MPRLFIGRARSPHSRSFNADGSSLSSIDAAARRHPTSSDDRANMDPRSKQTKVTLPPLSSLTTSIDLERRHDLATRHERDPLALSPPTRSHDVAMQAAKQIRMADLESGPRYMPQDRRWSVDHDNVRSAVCSHTVHKGGSTTAVSGSPSLRNPAPTSSSSTLRVIESTRPRSFSSPHRNRLKDPARRSSLADTSEVDRLLEGLIYIQDINRRLGLTTSGPASPSIFQNPGAAERLRGKLEQELNIMAHFSRARAKSVAEHLGFPAYLVPGRKASQEAVTQQYNVVAPIIGTDQAGHVMRPRADSTDRAHSSMARLTLDERRYRHLDCARHTETIENEYEDARRGYHLNGLSTYASCSFHADPSLRTISRAISFEHPRSVQHRSQPTHHAEHGQSDLDRFDVDAGMQPDHAMRAAMVSTDVPPMYCPDGQRQQQMELLDRRRLAGKGMKRVRKRKNEHHQECLGCQAKETPEWRKGPMGPRTLCNACGLLFAKLTKRKQQGAEAAAKASGKTAQEIVREHEESPGAKQASLEALRAELNLANGMRNRASSSSAPIGDIHPIFVHMQPACSHKGTQDLAQPWPVQHREDLQPFSHQVPPHHRQTMSLQLGEPSHLRTTTGRANSLGYVESFEPLGGRPISSVSGPARHMRPYSQGNSGISYPSPSHPGRQRSASTLFVAAAPPYDRPMSPNIPPQRRHHPYM
ncbi:uncharacterized protein MEPE_04356 [Melanopsichium pennsylvanicum]|uniref:GATA-type domain-containing protein n=2 Tax=Melanopsichium pennsylvanicum TaxID=63383 RepID=A0AAJ4XPR7_9BASI|nr:glucocorticoid receptor-like protein [Melanopsichium pennsylvanicum 4]SNX85647.1 uncharacterized protein MEPE_04356 [Melanopsichium pennsylvanicum]